MRGDGDDGGGHEGPVDGPGEAFGDVKTGRGDAGTDESGEDGQRRFGGGSVCDSPGCDGDALSICDCG